MLYKSKLDSSKLTMTAFSFLLYTPLQEYTQVGSKLYLRIRLKELKWQYQKEWRLIGDAGQKIQAPAIKTVYLGENVQAVNTNEMEKFCNENYISLKKL